MTSSHKFKLSNYVFSVEREDGYATYHSIFGNICLLEKRVFTLLKEFENGKSIEEVSKKYKNKIAQKKVKELIDTFIKKSFLIKTDADELYDFENYIQKHNRDLKKGKEACIIQLVVTNICNFRCKYCFVDTMYCSEERAISQKAPDNQMMTTQDAEKYIQTVIKHIKKNGRKHLFIQFFGGEPLVNWPVIKHVLEEFSNGSRYNISIGYSIVTNGSLINEDIAKCLKKYNVAVIVSFDSPRGSDRILANGKNSGPLVKKNIELLNKYKNKISFNTAITLKTFDYIDKDLIDFALQNGVKEIGVVFDFNLDFYKKYSTEKIVNKFWKFYKYSQKNNIDVTGYWHHAFQLILEDKHFTKGGYKTCPAMGALLSIEPSGIVYSCKGSSAYFGNMKDFDNIFLSKNYQKYGKHPFERTKDCKGCEIENFCSNICCGTREKNFNSISKIHKPTCALYRQIIKLLIRDLYQTKLEYLKF